MIARTWRGETSERNAEGYLQHLQTAVLPELGAMPGFCGAWVLRKRSQAGYKFSVMTLWQTMESIRRFAGPDLGKAVVPSQAKSLLIEYDRKVRHYEVVAGPDQSQGGVGGELDGKREP